LILNRKFVWEKKRGQVYTFDKNKLAMGDGNKKKGYGLWVIGYGESHGDVVSLLKC